MQLVSENKLETVNCDKISITAKSSIDFDNMNGNDCSDTTESNLLEENSLNISENFDTAEIDNQIINKLVDTDVNPDVSGNLVEDSSSVVNCNNGNTDNEENDENCNHIDMENNTEESTAKSENTDNQLNESETKKTPTNSPEHNGFIETSNENGNIKITNDADESDLLFEHSDVESSHIDINKESDTDVSNTNYVDNEESNNVILHSNSDGNVIGTIENEINTIEPDTTVTDTISNDNINETNTECIQFEKNSCISDDSIVNDANSEDLVSTNKLVESVTENLNDGIMSSPTTPQSVDKEDLQIESCNDEFNSGSSDKLDVSSDPSESHSCVNINNLSSEVVSTIPEEDCTNILNEDIDHADVASTNVEKENESIDSINVDKKNIVSESTIDDRLDIDLIKLHQQPMDVDVEQPSDYTLEDSERDSSKQATLKDDAMVYIEKNIIDQIENDESLQKKFHENKINDSHMEVDINGTDKISSNESEKNEFKIQDSPKNGLSVSQQINSTDNLADTSNFNETNEARNDIDTKDCDSAEKEDNKAESVIIDTLDLLLSDDECEKLKNKVKASTDIKLDNVNECVSLDEDDDELLLISDEKNRTKKIITDDGKIDVVNNRVDQNEKETKIVKSDSSILVDDDDDILVTKNIEKEDSIETSTNNDCLNDTNSDKQEENQCKSPILSNYLGPKENESENVENLKENNHVKNNYMEDFGNYPIIPISFMNNFKSNLETMTRENLEEFCLVKIVEAVIKRSNLSEAEAKLKAQAKSIDVLRKTLSVVTKQNRDLEIVMRNLTNEHKRRKNEIIEPVKISRSVGFQVGSSSLKNKSSKSPNQTNANNPKPKPQKPDPPAYTPPVQHQQQPNKMQTNHIENTNTNNPVKKIPIVPLPTNSQQTNPKQNSKPQSRNPPVQLKPRLSPTITNGPPAVKQVIEKRPLDTSIDLTDDEPPVKIPNLNISQTKVTKVHTPPNFSPGIASPRLSFVLRQPLPQNNAFISKQLVVQKQFTPQGGSAVANVTISPSTNYHSIPIRTAGNNTLGQRPPLYPVYKRHPAPLPAIPPSKIPPNPNWKGLPPKPLLKISRVSNGIVISWVMETDIDKRFENIASYQIFAYQETTSPPQSELWKKIGDVKALPLPMACTLTQFMAGYKYYFAVRAVDVRSRIGPFSTPDCIILRNDK